MNKQDLAKLNKKPVWNANDIKNYSRYKSDQYDKLSNEAFNLGNTKLGNKYDDKSISNLDVSVIASKAHKMNVPQQSVKSGVLSSYARKHLERAMDNSRISDTKLAHQLETVGKKNYAFNNIIKGFAKEVDGTNITPVKMNRSASSKLNRSFKPKNRKPSTPHKSVSKKRILSAKRSRGIQR